MTVTTRTDPMPDWFSARSDELTLRSLAFARTHTLAGLVVGIVVDDRLCWQGTFGVADVTTERPVDERTLFQIASITKTFTATAIVQLRDRGLLELDERAVRYLPELAAAGGLPYASRLTVRQLLQHSSGLQGNPSADDPHDPPNLLQPEIVAALPRVRVLTPPGTEFRYSNLGYRLLAEIVHRVDGRIWPVYARDELLVPLGMHDSGAAPTSPQLQAQAHGAGRYRDRPAPLDAVDTALAMGDGDLWSSLQDLTAWVVEQLSPVTGRASTVLGRESLLEMQAGTFVASPDRAEARGLGWNTVRREHHVLVTHGGSLDGFNTHVCFSPQASLGVVALTNSMPRASVGDLAWELADLLVPARAEREPGRQLVLPAPPPNGYESLLGRYVDPVDGQEVHIEFRGGRLVYRDPSGGETEALEATDDPMVFLADREEWLFTLDTSGAVDCLNAHGYPLLRDLRCSSHDVTDLLQLRAAVGEPGDLVLAKQLDHLDAHARAFIALSPFVVIATADADGSADASPRGDPPGFVRVIDDRRMLLPDRTGNRRVDSMSNVLENPRLGMVFFIPGTPEVLRVNGRASITRDPRLLAECAVRGRPPSIGLLVDVEEVFLHCARALLRSRVWDVSTWPERDALPSLGRMLADQIGRPELSEDLDEELAQDNESLY